MSKTSKPPSTTQSKNANGDLDTFDASEYEFNISASLMSKILEDSIQDTVTKHCDTCTCNKSQTKPFCYNETYYSTATQTFLSGEMKTSLCLSCNSEMKSLNSNMSIGSVSPHGIRIINERSPNHIVNPLYIIPQQSAELPKDIYVAPIDNSIKTGVTVKNDFELDDKIGIGLDAIVAPQPIPKDVINIEDLKHIRKSNGMSMEPAVHHKLCDRTRTPLSSHKGSILSVAQEDLLMAKDIPLIAKETKSKSEKCEDNASLRKNSQSSMGAMSRTSSIAKSTVSNHKSNTAVGPGPRFCHLRLQAGSKNILLDNAEPDVPPVLYRRQSKCNESSLFKELTDDVDNFLLDKHESQLKDDIKNDNVVVESTLIDVHVDSTYKEPNFTIENATINPVLLNVSSSPLQPLKTHNFSNSSENNNNKSVGSQHNTSEVDNLLSEFNADITNVQNNNNVPAPDVLNTTTVTTPTDNHDVKIFNFDRYEQNKLSSQYSKPLRKIEMAQLHSLENTRISKDLPPQGNLPKSDKKTPSTKPTLPPIVNVYPNLTQTHLKVNENKKAFTNEQSTSSLSSDDSAALLQKQQLLRVAEWVEKNLEQHNNYNDPLEEDVNFVNRAARRDSKLSRLTETLNELALNMPHPVSKFSKSYSKEVQKSWVHNATQNLDKAIKQPVTKIATNVIKETIFPVESGDATVTEISNDNANSSNAAAYKAAQDFRDAFNGKSEKEISPEDLARMEYNVKKFLLSGPHWVSPGSAGRSRRTSSKTETDV